MKEIIMRITSKDNHVLVQNHNCGFPFYPIHGIQEFSMQIKMTAAIT